MYMYYWLFFYIPALAIAVNLPALTNKVFHDDNLDILKQYYTFTDFETFKIHTIGFYRGQLENSLGLYYSLAMIVLVILAFFFANHWWVALIALVSGTLLRGIRAIFGKLHYGSLLYFIELIIEPILLFFAYYFLISAHNRYL